VAQRVGIQTTLLFHDRRTRTGRVVSSTPWPHFTPGKDPVPILQEAEWAPESVWTGGKSRPNQDSIPELGYNVMKGTEYVLSFTSVVLTEKYVTVNSKDLIATTEYLTL